MNPNPPGHDIDTAPLLRSAQRPPSVEAVYCHICDRAPGGKPMAYLAGRPVHQRCRDLHVVRTTPGGLDSIIGAMVQRTYQGVAAILRAEGRTDEEIIATLDLARRWCAGEEDGAAEDAKARVEATQDAEEGDGHVG